MTKPTLIDKETLDAAAEIERCNNAVKDTPFGENEPRCQMCGDVLVNTELNDHDVERGVCSSCYSAEVNAGESFTDEMVH